MIPLTTQAADWWSSRLKRQRLPAHELRCTLCNEPSEAEVCTNCIETTLQSEVQQ